MWGDDVVHSQVFGLYPASCPVCPSKPKTLMGYCPNCFTDFSEKGSRFEKIG